MRVAVFGDVGVSSGEKMPSSDSSESEVGETGAGGVGNPGGTGCAMGSRGGGGSCRVDVMLPKRATEKPRFSLFAPAGCWFIDASRTLLFSKQPANQKRG